MLDQKTNTKPQRTTYTTSRWSDLLLDDMALVERRLREPIPGQHEMITHTIQALLESGGKRMRPALLLLTARYFDANLNHAVSMAAAVEMLHTATLVHDDLIDGSNLRRGNPTLNAIWSHDIAVLIGDFMFARAASLISEVEIIPIMRLFSNTLEIILNGEIVQNFTKWQIDQQEYEKRIYAKTAALFVLCTHSASLLGNADPDELDAMITFGKAIGTAFQIVDDILDFTGSANKVGKPIGGDLSQGIFTLPAIIYTQDNPGDEDVDMLLSHQENDPELIQRLVLKIKDSGAITNAMDEARKRIETGKSVLSALHPSLYLNSLVSLADQVVNRQY
jgi:geranylgeranyl pyrophosphate synthase